MCNKKKNKICNRYSFYSLVLIKYAYSKSIENVYNNINIQLIYNKHVSKL